MDSPMESEESKTAASVHLHWRALLENSSLTGLDFRTYWRDAVPPLFSPRRGALTPVYGEESVKATLYDPLERFIFNGQLAIDVLEQLRATESPPTLCGRVFKMGEPTYSCRDCGMDPTCVLCVDCFKLSLHRNHRYKMSTSSGGGYCDCGDLEAWKCSPFCDRHAPACSSEEQPSPVDRLPPDMVVRARLVFEHVLEYCYQILCWEDPITLPEGLSTTTAAAAELTPEVLETYATMLFNDEIHTYEQVIRTLSRAISCSQKEAIDFATTVDREGRSIVMCSSFAGCKEVKGFVERITSQHGPKPLRVVVMDPNVVAHQSFALRLLAWFQQLIGGSQAFRLLFSEVVSMSPRRLGEERSILEGVIRSDASLWKSARSQWHQLFIGGLLMEADSKRTFSRIFTRNYPHLMKDFIEDDHDHSLSVTSLSVQIFTVPTLAHMLISQEDVLAVVLRTFCTECEVKLNANLKLAFERNHASVNFRRAQYVLFDLKYLLSAKPDVWDTVMRRNFLHGFAQLLKLLSWMQGMDATVRQVGQHMEYEPDWESAFNLYIKLSPVITQVLEWCGSDRLVLVKAYRATLKNLSALNVSQPRVVQEVADHSVACINSDVAVQPLSIHLPLSRLLAGLHLHLDKFGLDFNSPEFSVKDKMCPVTLMESPLRIQVMIAQVASGMWRRNGYSLLNQIYFYRNVRCRSEMYDRDIVMLQVGASLVESNEFVIHLLNKFGLMNWVREDYEMGFPKAEEDSVRQIVTLVEEFLGLLLVLVAERHVPGVGRVTEEDRISKEIIQQLCIEPMAHSHLSKTLPEDANHETGMESVVDRVATFRKPHGTGKGIYEINPQCYAHYNPFYYHYSREEQSKAEEAQRKRKKLAHESECCPPPLPPALCQSFEMLVYVLQCDVMTHVMRLVLERSLNLRARSYSDGQSLKVLHLIGFALHEEQRFIESGNPAFQFTSRSAKDNILVLLEALSTGPPQRRDVHKDLLVWVIQKFRAVQKMSNDANQSGSSTYEGDRMDTSETHQVGDVEEVDDQKMLEKLKEERKKRSEMAAARRDRIMAQMAAMQKNFIREHAELFQKNPDGVMSSGRALSGSLMDLSEVAGPANVDATTQPFQGPPVCLGLEQTSRQWIPNRHICILCQEEQAVELGGRAMVLSALVQRSTVLSKTRSPVRLEEGNSALVQSLMAPADLFSAPHTSTCGHVMHADCWQKLFDAVLAKERRRPVRARHHLSFDVDKMEFLCPLCECLSNTVIPIVPALGTVLPELSDRKVNLTTDDWISILRTVVLSAKEIECITKEDDSDATFELNAVDDRGELMIRTIDTMETVPRTEFQLCSLQELCPHLESDKALKLAWLYPDGGGAGRDVVGGGGSAATSAEPASTKISASLAEMMALYASSTYTIGLGVNPHPEDERVPLMAWYSCAYTIHAIENLLRDQGKPLFGDLSSRQSDCLGALVRFSAVCAHVSQPSVLEGQCHRLLRNLLLQASTGSEDGKSSNDDEDLTTKICVSDVDAFGALIAFVLLLPYAVSARNDDSSAPKDACILRRLPHGDVRDAFALQLAYALHVVQILSSTDFSSDHANASSGAAMEHEVCDDDDDLASATALANLYACIPSSFKTEVDAMLLLRKVRRLSVPFLRCSALFFHYMTGVPAPDDLHTLSDDEFSPLCRYLGLSNDFSKILGSSELVHLAKSWLRHPGLKKPAAAVEYPLALNQLVQLPVDYSELINDVSLFTCPNSDGDDSRTPTMCLVCGKMLCSQSYCCQTELDGVLVGACTNHAQECGAGVGIFLRVRECKVLLLAGKTKGCFVPPPYLDEYGETDQGLRRGNPLHLCQENYRKLQKLWLSHGIPEEIAHSLESNTQILTIEWQHL